MNTITKNKDHDDNVKQMIEMKNILTNMTIPSVLDIELSSEWKKILLINTNYLQSTIYDICNNNDIKCNKCHRTAIYKTNDIYLCWEHSL